MKLIRIDQVAIDEGRSYSVAKFDAYRSNRPVDVIVNHTTGEIMGQLYPLGDNVGPVSIDDIEARNAHELAWKQLKQDLNQRAGVEIAQQADEAIKLIPIKGLSDNSGRRIY
jgi:hypothetical protein